MAEDAQQDVAMDETLLESCTLSGTSSRKKESMSRELSSFTISKPPFAYAQVEAVTVTTGQAGASTTTPLDALQIRSYCTAALRQFLGATGVGMPLDLLQMHGREFWVRLPREDLSLFAAALAAWTSAGQDGETTVLRLRAAGNWLGGLLGQTEQRRLWNDA